MLKRTQFRPHVLFLYVGCMQVLRAFVLIHVGSYSYFNVCIRCSDSSTMIPEQREMGIAQSHAPLSIVTSIKVGLKLST